jgi:hypothetical protein
MEIKKFEEFTFNPDGSQGWINVKIDDNLFRRMKRYVLALDKIVMLNNNDTKSIYNLYKKVKALSDMNKYIDSDRITVQDKISVITILQYLKELKENFAGSSAGFLMEGFLAALIHGDIQPGHGKVDIFGTEFKTDIDMTYQIKLYQKGSSIKIRILPNEEMCDYYVICVKDNDTIKINILSGKDSSDPYYIDQPKNVVHKRNDLTEYPENWITHHRSDDTEHFTKPYIVIDTSKLLSNISLDINTNNINNMIRKCGKSINDYIKTVYGKLSELHYDIDTLITGVNKDIKQVNPDDAYTKVGTTIEDITTEMSKLKKGIVRKRPNSGRI